MSESEREKFPQNNVPLQEAPPETQVKTASFINRVRSTVSKEMGLTFKLPRYNKLSHAVVKGVSAANIALGSALIGNTMRPGFEDSAEWKNVVAGSLIAIGSLAIAISNREHSQVNKNAERFLARS
ncbi:hypothetical protein A3F65_01305 [Candidatus Saccharibacteria bacterium RIFCSPHIGHO2_12_FULL_47_16b]|nr:MAG: hypothetical protein A3F65_01305 [Candidatus Saccharibacteria bacterium RIFCSPHIGHO2_12_FULL_47_16b]